MSTRSLALIVLLAALPMLGAAESFRDPMRPPGRSEPAHRGANRGPQLHGVMIRDGSALALIDQRAVSVGERIGPWTILAISLDRVRVLNAGREQDIRVSAARPSLSLTANAKDNQP